MKVITADDDGVSHLAGGDNKTLETKSQKNVNVKREGRIRRVNVYATARNNRRM